DRVVGVPLLDPRADEALGLAVGDRDGRAVALRVVLHHRAVVAERELAGFVRELGGEIEQRADLRARFFGRHVGGTFRNLQGAAAARRRAFAVYMSMSAARMSSSTDDIVSGSNCATPMLTVMRCRRSTGSASTRARTRFV